RFVRDPAEIVHLGQEVRVRVLEVDLQRRRIQLSMKEAADAPQKRAGS
ncbi:MAG: S1 RNA-binding domain-containing protein, partial [Bacteroidetes bacterium]